MGNLGQDEAIHGQADRPLRARKGEQNLAAAQSGCRTTEEGRTSHLPICRRILLTESISILDSLLYEHATNIATPEPGQPLD